VCKGEKEFWVVPHGNHDNSIPQADGPNYYPSFICAYCKQPNQSEANKCWANEIGDSKLITCPVCNGSGLQNQNKYLKYKKKYLDFKSQLD
jgi:hypothetical protein